MRDLRDSETLPDVTGLENRAVSTEVLAPSRAARPHRLATRAYLMEPLAPVNTRIQRR